MDDLQILFSSHNMNAICERFGFYYSITAVLRLLYCAFARFGAGAKISGRGAEARADAEARGREFFNLSARPSYSKAYPHNHLVINNRGGETVYDRQ